MFAFILSALLGLALIVVVALLARRNMVREMKQQEEPATKEKADKEMGGQSGGPDQS